MRAREGKIGMSADMIRCQSTSSREISWNNGVTFGSAEEFLAARPDLWDVAVERMDDDVREQVAYDLAPCAKLAFLREYLRRALADLIIG